MSNPFAKSHAGRTARGRGTATLPALVFVLAFLTQPGCRPRPAADEFVHTRTPVVALTHVRVFDGTGAPAKSDQTLVIEGGRIKEVRDASGAPAPDGARVLDLRGRTVIPGLVGMHEHLFYAVNGGDAYVNTGTTFPRLYLACGVTTIRTAGTASASDFSLIGTARQSFHSRGRARAIPSPALEGARERGLVGVTQQIGRLVH